MKTHLSNKDVLFLVQQLATRIRDEQTSSVIRLFGVPRGGIPVVYALLAYGCDFVIADNMADATVIVDDIIDSGNTCDQYSVNNKPFYALINKKDASSLYCNSWVVFPWEHKEDGQDEGIEGNVQRILQYIEPETYRREGIQETPKRVAKAMAEKFSGYNVDIPSMLKVFEDGAEGYDEMVLVKDIEFHSSCEHHLETIAGVAHVAYIPNGSVLGLSKLARLVDAHAKRLQVQERMTKDITNDLMRYVKPLGAACVIEATHGCMQCRGVKKQNSTTVTSSLRGAFKDEQETRSEFLSLVNAPRRV